MRRFCKTIRNKYKRLQNVFLSGKQSRFPTKPTTMEASVVLRISLSWQHLFEILTMGLGHERSQNHFCIVLIQKCPQRSTDILLCPDKILQLPLRQSLIQLLPKKLPIKSCLLNSCRYAQSTPSVKHVLWVQEWFWFSFLGRFCN